MTEKAIDVIVILSRNFKVIETSLSGSCLSVRLTGRIDSSNAQATQEEIAKALGEQATFDELWLDVDQVDYLSSAGLRVLLSTQKKMAAEGKKMSVVNPNPEVLSVFDMTGFSEILNIRQKIKHIELNGAVKINEGLCAEIYRIDDETVLKLYKKGFDESMMYKEKDYAKKALVLGIPTAISYDMVECEGRIGILFELIKARDLASTMRDDIQNLPKYATMFADLALEVHRTDGSKTDLPRKKDNCRILLRDASFLSEHEREVM